MDELRGSSRRAGARVALAAALSAGLLGACSLLTSYDGLLGSAAEDASVHRPEAGRQDAASDDASEDTSSPGWTLTALGPDDDAGCPPGFGTPTPVREGIDGGAATCSCDCTVTQPPSCSNGMAAATYGIGACNVGPFDIPITGSCTGIGELSNVDLPAGSEALIVPVTASGGSCGAMAALDPTSVSYALTGIACTLTGPGATCAVDAGGCVPPTLPPGYVACIALPGDSACPGQPPFTTRHVVGSTVTFTCGDGGGCGCSLDAGCPPTTGTLYTDTACSEGGLPVIVDGQCHPLGGPSVGYKSLLYEGGVPHAACVSTPDSPQQATGLMLQDIQTLCCQP